MTYLDWCQLVFERVAEQVLHGDDMARNYGVSSVNFGDEVEARGGEELGRGFRQAISDLDVVGLFEKKDIGVTLGRLGARLVEMGTTTVAELWPNFFRDLHLEKRHRDVIAAALPLTEQQRDGYAFLTQVRYADVLASTCETPTPGGPVGLYNAAHPAYLEGVLTIGDFKFRPTYVGIVLSTQRELSKLERLIAELEKRWELPNVDFKRELSLSTGAQKGEFVKDMIALGTTQMDGDRYYVIGWDPKTRQFVPPGVDPKLTEEQMQQILGAYVDPPPHLNYQTCPWRGGNAGLITVTRNPHHVPYKVAKAIGKLKPGDMFVRHGTVTEPPTPRELAVLEEEARRAGS